MIELMQIMPPTTQLARTVAVRQRTGVYGGYFPIIVGIVAIPNNPIQFYDTMIECVQHAYTAIY